MFILGNGLDGGAVDLDLGADIDYDLLDKYLKVLLEGEVTVTLNVRSAGRASRVASRGHRWSVCSA